MGKPILNTHTKVIPLIQIKTRFAIYGTGGDGNASGWLGPYESGVIVNASYDWSEKGDYEIKVKTKDIYEAESEWSDLLPISMPRNRNMSFLRFLENHPYIFPMLGQLLEL